jgi:biotin transport system substrate-specific component
MGETKQKRNIYHLTMMGIMAAVICVLGPMSIPIGPVPVSFTNLAIFLGLYLLGWKRGSISFLVYMLIGMVGMPVFSGYAGGFGKLLGPTGGYIIGFLPMAVVAGWVMDHTQSRLAHLVGMILGTAICYTLGTAWFCFQAGYAVGAALSLCVFPFIPWDLGKMVVAMTLGPVIRKRLEKAGLLKEIA